MEIITKMEEIAQLDFFLYDIDLMQGARILEFSRRSIGKHSGLLRPLRYNSPFCYVFNVNVLLEAYYYRSCNQVIKRVLNQERLRRLCIPKERISTTGNKNYHTRHFWKYLHPRSQVFENVAVFELKSICVQENEAGVTHTTT